MSFALDFCRSILNEVMNSSAYMTAWGVAALLTAGTCGAAPFAPAEDILEWFERSNGVYSIFEATRAHDENTLRKRLEEGEESVNQINEQGDTALHLAAASGRDSLVEMLLEAGADPLIKNKVGRIPSEIASTAQIRSLCQAGEARRLRELGAIRAIRENNIDALERELLDHDLNPNALGDDHQQSLLAVAVEAGSLEAARMLLRAGANAKYIQPNGKNLLHVAAHTGASDIIPLLLEAGADPLFGGNNGATPLHDAIWAGKTQAALALIPAYASVDYNPDGGGNGYPIGMAIQYNNAEVVKALLKAGLNPNDEAFSGNPLTVQAARSDRAEIMKLLLEAGADKTAKDDAGKSAADYATGETADALR